MDELVCEHQISYPINITLIAKIFVVRATEASIDAVMVVHHASDSIKSKAINLEFLDVVSQIAKQKS